MFPIILIWLALVTGPALEATALTVEDGLYSRLTVQVTEAVPRQLCHRALNNLQVRNWNMTNDECLQDIQRLDSNIHSKSLNNTFLNFIKILFYFLFFSIINIIKLKSSILFTKWEWWIIFSSLSPVFSSQCYW